MLTSAAQSLLALIKTATFGFLGTPHLGYHAATGKQTLTGGTLSAPGDYAHLLAKPSSDFSVGRLVIELGQQADFTILRFFAKHDTDSNDAQCIIRVTGLSPTADLPDRDLMGKLMGEWTLTVGDAAVSAESSLVTDGEDYGWVDTIDENPLGALAVGDFTLGGAQYLGGGDDGVRELCLRSDGCSLLVIEMTTSSDIKLGVLYRSA